MKIMRRQYVTRGYHRCPKPHAADKLYQFPLALDNQFRNRIK
jgi:hypothetical protein